MATYDNKLVILKKKGEGMVVPIPDTLEDIMFGRAEECNIRIQKASVSQQHARIFFDAQGLVRASTRHATNKQKF